MNNSYQELKNYTKGDITSIIFVVASILNIIASDKEKEYIIGKNKKDKYTASNIYLLVLLILIILYLYFIKANYEAYNNCKDNERKTYLVRLYGSIFFLLGGFCFLYYRINDRNNIQTNVEI